MNNIRLYGRVSSFQYGFVTTNSTTKNNKIVRGGVVVGIGFYNIHVLWWPRALGTNSLCPTGEHVRFITFVRTPYIHTRIYIYCGRASYALPLRRV